MREGSHTVKKSLNTGVVTLLNYGTRVGFCVLIGLRFDDVNTLLKLLEMWKSIVLYVVVIEEEAANSNRYGFYGYEIGRYHGTTPRCCDLWMWPIANTIS